MNQEKLLAETNYFDYHNPVVQDWIASLEGARKEHKIIDAYYQIRDRIAYNPYTFASGDEALKASYAASQPSAYCIPKSALMVAIARSLGIPARIGFADVRNHLSSNKLNQWLKTDLFVMHGYAQLYLHDNWVKCTPVFNQSLCEKLNIKPLDFDGIHDSLFHPYTQNGDSHMEYVFDHGTFDDMPAEYIFTKVQQAYPHLEAKQLKALGGDLELEID